MCDARDDDSSNAADKKIKLTSFRVIEKVMTL